VTEDLVAKVEIIPPSRRGLPARRSEHVPTASRVNPGGIVSSTLMRWEANRHSRTISAVAERTRSEAALFDAQTQLAESYVKRQRAAARVQELPEIIANDHAIRRTERWEALRQAQHQHEMSEVHRQTELAHADRALVDARQALRAQRDHGYASYELEWRKRACDLLEVELTMEERKAILREHRADLCGGADGGGLPRNASDDEVEEALHEARAQLRASGLDTGKIDAVLARRATASK
jgi:hypothetical protein